jgi:hypothetical protein
LCASSSADLKQSSLWPSDLRDSDLKFWILLKLICPKNCNFAYVSAKYGSSVVVWYWFLNIQVMSTRELDAVDFGQSEIGVHFPNGLAESDVF